MPKFRTKPAVVEAFQVTMMREPTKDTPDIPDWLSEALAKKWTEEGAVYWLGGNLFVQTLEGTLEVSLYDWIIRGIQGELYPCKPDIFEATYEAVEEVGAGGFEGFDHREMVEKKLEERFPALERHSGGAGCGGWDLGFFVKDQPEEDGRSLELRGLGRGFVRAEVVANYRNRPPGAPTKIFLFGTEEVTEDGDLPTCIVEAAEYMIAAVHGDPL